MERAGDAWWGLREVIGKLKEVVPSRERTFLGEPGRRWKGERKREDQVFEPEFKVGKETG